MKQRYGDPEVQTWLNLLNVFFSGIQGEGEEERGADFYIRLEITIFNFVIL
jgi:hypothetical protein